MCSHSLIHDDEFDEILRGTDDEALNPDMGETAVKPSDVRSTTLASETQVAATLVVADWSYLALQTGKCGARARGLTLQ